MDPFLLSPQQLDNWLLELAESTAGELGVMLRSNQPGERGYYHTLREICQQPLTWMNTAKRVLAMRLELQELITETLQDQGHHGVVLTGSGSSLYVGECLSLTLQQQLGVPVSPLASGLILTHAPAAILSEYQWLIVSFARSGDSPESKAVVDRLRDACRHLIITCNREGQLALSQKSNPRARVLILDQATCDRSLVMTSSFTNMLWAGRALGCLASTEDYERSGRNLAQLAMQILREDSASLAQVGSLPFQSAVYLGSGVCFGSAREAALKMLEMTAGQVTSFAESYLGVRHGPMSAIHPDTLIVCFLSSAPEVRAYELDLIHELNRKRLGRQKVIVGQDVPREVLLAGDTVVEWTSENSLDDASLPMIDVLVGQILAYFRCLSLGLKPDSPSSEGVISRVVNEFPIHK